VFLTRVTFGSQFPAKEKKDITNLGTLSSHGCPTVDGRNPAPSGMVKTLSIMG